MRLASAVMMVPTCSPLSARVSWPGLRPLMTCTERRCSAFFSISSTARSTTTSSRSIASISATVAFGMNRACLSFFGSAV